MNRRLAINIALTTAAGIFLIPSCMQEKSKPDIVLKNINVSGDQQKMLTDLAEIIIPKTSSPGAADLSTHQFALMMVDDCYDPELRSKFEKGIAEFESLSKNNFGNSFIKCSGEQKEKLINTMENQKDAAGGAAFFYNNFKKLAIQSFTSSQYYLTKIHVYELVPGRFHGCVPLIK
jgi:hypothetical protein